jgi:hypothetical protein
MRYLLLLVAVAIYPASAAAQSSQIVTGNSKKSILWSAMVGKSVTVEGLAWGGYSKGLGQHLILPYGRVYIRGFRFAKQFSKSRKPNFNGRLISIIGILRKGHVKKALPGEQGSGSDFDYFYIDSKSWKIVERLTNPQILPRYKK